MDQRKRQTLQLGAVSGAALLLAKLPLSVVAATADRGVKMNAITLDPAATTLVNVLTCKPADQAALVDLLRQNTDAVIATLDGWRSTSLIAAPDGTRVVIISQWRDPAAVEVMRGDPRMKAYFPKIIELASLDSIMGSAVFNETR